MTRSTRWPGRSRAPTGGAARSSSSGPTRRAWCRWRTGRCCAGGCGTTPRAAAAGWATPWTTGRTSSTRCTTRWPPTARSRPARSSRSSATAGERRARAHGGWWHRSDVKVACEHLFATGVLTTGTRRGFRRAYAVTEDVLPPDVLARDPDRDESMRELTRHAAAALGVATEPDLRDHYRLPPAESRVAVDRAGGRGRAGPGRGGGMGRARLPGGGTRGSPRKVTGRALLAPFDPLVWFRPRTERIFGFTYRIGIYTPAEQRTHGYYVFPFLLDGQLVGRVDLKTDRAAGVLRVPGAFAEPECVERGADEARVATEMAGSAARDGGLARGGRRRGGGRAARAGPLPGAGPGGSRLAVDEAHAGRQGPGARGAGQHGQQRLAEGVGGPGGRDVGAVRERDRAMGPPGAVEPGDAQPRAARRAPGWARSRRPARAPPSGARRPSRRPRRRSAASRRPRRTRRGPPRAARSRAGSPPAGGGRSRGCRRGRPGPRRARPDRPRRRPPRAPRAARG